MTISSTRLLAAAMASLALAGGLAACGDDDAPSGNSNAATSPPAATTPPAAKNSPAAKKVDAAFIRQMIPHHESAVDMARSAKQEATQKQIKVLAASIVAGQQKEIAEMRAIAKDLGVSTSGAGSQMAADAKTLGLSKDEMGMSMGAHSVDGADNFDQAFIDAMISHHEGAIAMAKAQQQSGADKRLTALAAGTAASQINEIARMQAWRKAWYGDAAPAADSKKMDGDHNGH